MQQFRSFVAAQAQIQQRTLPAQPTGRRAASTSGPSFTRQDVAVNPEEHLNSLFAPLKFPAELADRMLTHGSHSSAKVRHNARLSFMGASALSVFSSSPNAYCSAGRRVMQFYLLALLDSSPSLRADHEFDHLSEHTLNTYILGEHVAAAWRLGDVLKWSPPSKTLSGHTPKNVGLYKVLGGAVEAIVGGVNHQFVRHLTMLQCLLFTSMPYSGWRCFATAVPHTRAAPPPVARNLAGFERRVPQTCHDNM